jgi:hypothetical protein
MQASDLADVNLRVWPDRLVVATEPVVDFWTRDNPALNIAMLVFPIDAIKLWQSSS